jgi:rod shape determining protein RodA
LVAVLALFLLSFATLSSVALSRGGDFSFVFKQLFALVLGGVLAGFLMRREAAFFRTLAGPLYWIGVTSLVGVLFFGRELNGTTGWFVIGGFALQPVEYVKVALAIALAAFIAQKKESSLTPRVFWRVLWMVLLPVGLLCLQPDLGGAVIILGMGVLGLLYLGLRFRYLLLLAGLSAGVFWLSFSFLFLPYQQERVLTFLNPSSDPLRSGYNVNQAQIAIGAGGLFGRGLGEGTQSQLRFLPESQTDFIFAVISEELGLFGVMLVFGAFLLLFWRLLRISRSVPDSFVAALAFFGFALFFVEFSLHVGVNIGLLPATGVTLPFVSYGGSSLLFSLVMFGVVFGVSRAREVG